MSVSRRNGLLHLLVLQALVAFGCAGTETGNPSFEGELAYDAYSSDVARVALRSSGASEQPGVTLVDAAWLVLGDVSFSESCAGPSSDTEAHATGIGEGDHAAQGRVVTALALPEGDYCGASVPFARARDAFAGPSELAGHSILIDGVAPNGESFRLRSAMQGDVRLAGPAPFAIDENHDTVLIGFDLAVWLDAIAWDEAVVEGGLIEIDDAHNAALLAAFERAIGRGTGLYRSDATAPIDSSSPLARGQ
jgi:hypothetical protein